MIELHIQVDDDPSWAECTKEAVAERLADLGGVRVLEVKVDKPRQTRMGGYGAPAAPAGEKREPRAKVVSRRVVACPECGEGIWEMTCSDGRALRCELEARCYQMIGPEAVVTTTGEVRTGAFDGRGRGSTGLGYPVHRCKGG